VRMRDNYNRGTVGALCEGVNDLFLAVKCPRIVGISGPCSEPEVRVDMALLIYHKVLGGLTLLVRWNRNRRL
jgi:hypothetical protein